MKASDYKKIAYGEWYEQVDPKGQEAKDAHAQNVARCQAAIDEHAKKDRPLSVLVVHGSGRSSFKSCAQELSNSQMFLNSALKIYQTKDSGFEVKEAVLRNYKIEYCNCCYSTASPLCGFPCNCFPFDPMQELYPLVLKCDVMLISTGVNQSDIASRLNAFACRLISLDGGFYVAPEQFKPKDAEWRDHCVALEQKLAKVGKHPYDARMWGRVAAYFISSKDQENEMETAPVSAKEPPLNYIEQVAWILRGGFADYGFFHADKWYAGIYANPYAPISNDKAFESKQTNALKNGVRVVQQAIELGRRYQKTPPTFDGGGRLNRT